jgi:hypothetical protein
MIATAVIALLTLAHRWLAQTDEDVAMAIIYAITIVVVIPLLVLICVLSFYFRGMRSRGEFLNSERTSDMRNTVASGDAKRV